MQSILCLLACVVLFVHTANRAIAMENTGHYVENDITPRTWPNINGPYSPLFKSSLKHKQTRLIEKNKGHTHIHLFIKNLNTTSFIDSAKEQKYPTWVEKQDTKPALTPLGESLESLDERFMVNFKSMQEKKNNPYTLRMILSLISNELVDPRNNLFTSEEATLAYSSFDSSSSDILQIDRFPHRLSHAAYIRPEMHTECNPKSRCQYYFKSIGYIIGVAILNKQYLDLSFTSMFYKYILGKPMDLYDIEQVDASLFHHLQQIKDDGNYLSINKFTMTYKHYSKSGHKVIDLIENGSNTVVTEHNKYTYIDHAIKVFVENHIAPAMEELCTGLFEVIRKSELVQFNEDELKVLISGNTNIDLTEFKQYTYLYPEFIGSILYKTRLKWFWQTVESFDSDMKCRLLLYVTGTSRLQIDGFRVRFSEGWLIYPGNVWFNLIFHPSTHWISSSPLNGRMWLPSFPTFDQMKKGLESVLIQRGGVSVWYFTQLIYKQ